MTALSRDTLAHSKIEDAVAILTGTLFVAFGVTLLKSAGLGTGGTAGIAFLISHQSGWPLGAIFFAVNLPFLVFAQVAFGRVYVLKTLVAISLLSAETLLIPRLVGFSHVDPVLAAVMGGLLVGMGLLALIRHKTGIGGFGVMAVWCQERFGWRAGTVQMTADAAVVVAALVILPWMQVLLSVVGVVALNLVLALYHKPGRYLGF